MSIDLAMTAPQMQTHHEHHHDTDSMDVFGFWLYILSDCILFGSIFAVFIVMNQPNAFGPALKQYIDLPYVLIETACLLASNFTFGLSMLSLYRRNKQYVRVWLSFTL